LKVVQSALDKAPLFVALAVGIFRVITGVVVPFATLEDTSVPVVPMVSAATLVTVPTLQDLSADKSSAVPFIVRVLEVGTPPRPDNVYVGTFNVFPMNVEAPLLPVVVRVMADCLPLKTLQSEALKYPFDAPLACGMPTVPLPVTVPPVKGDVNVMDVTVPTLHERFTLKSWDVPLMVRVLDVGTPPNPERV